MVPYKISSMFQKGLEQCIKGVGPKVFHYFLGPFFFLGFVALGISESSGILVCNVEVLGVVLSNANGSVFGC